MVCAFLSWPYIHPTFTPPHPRAKRTKNEERVYFQETKNRHLIRLLAHHEFHKYAPPTPTPRNKNGSQKTTCAVIEKGMPKQRVVNRGPSDRISTLARGASFRRRRSCIITAPSAEILHGGICDRERHIPVGKVFLPLLEQ